MWSKLILISFLCAGTTDTMFKVVVETGFGHAGSSYILIYNCFALLLALFFCVRKKIMPRKKEIAAGLGSGICIGAGIMFAIKALTEIPGVVYFPSVSAGNLLLVTLLSAVLWKEKLSMRQIAGLMVAVSSIILIVLP